MPPIEDTTTNRGYQKPNAANLLIDDVARIRAALDSIDADMVTKAPLASPALTGNPTAPTPVLTDNDTSIATTAFVQGQGFLKSGDEAVTSVASKTGAVTLAVGDVSGAAPLASPNFTGTPTAPTPAQADDSTKLATTAWVRLQNFGGQTGGNSYYVQSTPPATPADGDLWFDLSSSIEYVRINDGNSAQWVETGFSGTGQQGPAGTIAVGTVTTGAAGSSVQITNSGSASAATLNFTIPRGDTGNTGATGPMGPKAVQIDNPTASEKVRLFHTDASLTISKIQSLVAGSTPSATFSIRYGADFSGAGTEVVVGGLTCTNSTTGLATTSFNNATIPAGSHVWLTTSAISGTVDSLSVSLAFA